jgi:hypothetical protein
MAAKSGNTIYWFRKALRLHDNPSLVSAIKVCILAHDPQVELVHAVLNIGTCTSCCVRRA